MRIKLSKSDWRKVGHKMGWLKKSQATGTGEVSTPALPATPAPATPAKPATPALPATLADFHQSVIVQIDKFSNLKTSLQKFTPEREPREDGVALMVYQYPSIEGMREYFQREDGKIKTILQGAFTEQQMRLQDSGDLAATPQQADWFRSALKIALERLQARRRELQNRLLKFTNARNSKYK